jgi:hypothetical protein
MKIKLSAPFTLLSAIFLGTFSPALAIDAASALALYTNKQYAASADAFEQVFPTAKREARLYYFAALANTAAHRNARAKQLFDYIIANFPSSAEAGLAMAAITSVAPTSALPGAGATNSSSELTAITKITDRAERPRRKGAFALVAIGF